MITSKHLLYGLFAVASGSATLLGYKMNEAATASSKKPTVTATVGNSNQMEWSVGMIDVCFTKNWTAKNILLPGYENRIRNLHVNSLTLTGGSTSDYAQSIIGNTKVFGVGNGYNCCCIPDVIGGACMQTFTINGQSYDFNNAVNQLAQDLYLPVVLTANLHYGKLAMLQWQLQFYGATKVIYGQEQNIQANDQWWQPNLGATYCDSVNKYISSVLYVYPFVKNCFDAAPVTSTQKRDKNWNAAQLKNNAQAGDVYWQLDNLQSDSQSTFTGRIFADTGKMKFVIANGIAMLDSFTKKFPGKQIFITQFNTASAYNPSGKNIYPNSFFAGTYLVKSVAAQLAWNDTAHTAITYECFWNAKQLIDKNDSVNLNYRFLAAIGNLFTSPCNYLSISNAGGFVLVATQTTAGKNKFVILNETGTDKALFTSVSINGKTIKVPAQNVTGYYSTSLTDTMMQPYNLTSTVKAFSIQEIEF